MVNLEPGSSGEEISLYLIQAWEEDILEHLSLISKVLLVKNRLYVVRFKTTTSEHTTPKISCC